MASSLGRIVRPACRPIRQVLSGHRQQQGLSVSGNWSVPRRDVLARARRLTTRSLTSAACAYQHARPVPLMRARSFGLGGLAAAPVAARSYWWPAWGTASPPPAGAGAPPQVGVVDGKLLDSAGAPSSVAGSPATPSPLPSSSSSPLADDAVNATAAPPADVIGSSEAILPDAAADLVTSIPLPPPPLELGDLHDMGLAGFSPAGLFRWLLELINVTTGLPWFWTIVAGSVFARVAVFPLAVKSIRNAGLLQKWQPQMDVIAREMEAARRAGATDPMALQRLALRQKGIIEKSGFNMTAQAMSMFVQIPVMMGVFFGVRGLCNSGLEQLKWSGVLWPADLTAPDETWGLAAIFAVAVNWQILTAMRDVDFSGPRIRTAHMYNAFRLATPLFVWFMGVMPSGLLVSIISGIVATIAQAELLRLPRVRSYFKIPPQPVRDVKVPTLVDTVKYLNTLFMTRVWPTLVQGLKAFTTKSGKPRVRVRR